MDSGVFNLAVNPVHLGLGARVIPLDLFTGEPEWYEHYAASTSSDGIDGRLVTMHRFMDSWQSWEVHPEGEELVLCLEGALHLFQDIDGEIHSVVLKQGEAIINPRGVWHTADVDGTATALFITAGMGTENRPR
ncbi:MAG TPA: cupin domain-containing protein [Acidimicrobiales bacterium]|jgi:mannose-6-phosphate isomerase-like protein (cupin superfamily)